MITLKISPKKIWDALSKFFKRILRWLSKNWFYTTLIAVAVIGGVCAFLVVPFAVPQPFSKDDSISTLRQAVLVATGGVLAILTLWENRRKNDQEHMRQVHAERRTRYATAIEQLADEKAPIRLGGVYTLIKLVDEWLADEKTLPSKEERREEGQAIINSLCAYIRSPFDLTSKSKVLSENEVPESYESGIQQFAKDQARFREEKELRLTILDAIKTRLNDGIITEKDGTKKLLKGPWSDFDYDFSNTIFFYSIDFRNSHFNASSNFIQATFTQNADFSGAKFTQNADFSGAKFTQNANFFRAEFTEASFFRAEFTEYAKFSEAKFTEYAKFSEAKFTQNANFSGATFTEYAEFSGAEFTEASFSMAKFTRFADFSGAKFPQNANFFRAEFTEASFSRAKFTRFADFSGAKFTEASFSRAKFTEASFSRAKFTQNANFSAATFTQNADFSEVKFTRFAHFFRAKFIGYAKFSAAEFTKNANFSAAKFIGYTNFSAAKFTEASFSRAKFIGYAKFSGATFTQNADFSAATFEDKPKFEYTLDNKTYKARFSYKAEPKDYNFEVSYDSPYKIETEEQEHNGVNFTIPKGATLFDPDEPSEQEDNGDS